MSSMEWIALIIGLGIMAVIGGWAIAISRPFQSQDKR